MQHQKLIQPEYNGTALLSKKKKKKALTKGIFKEALRAKEKQSGHLDLLRDKEYQFPW